MAGWPKFQVGFGYLWIKRQAGFDQIAGKRDTLKIRAGMWESNISCRGMRESAAWSFVIVNFQLDLIAVHLGRRPYRKDSLLQ